MKFSLLNLIEQSLKDCAHFLNISFITNINNGLRPIASVLQLNTINLNPNTYYLWWNKGWNDFKWRLI